MLKQYQSVALRYPNAPYAYFKIDNLVEAREQFLSGAVEQPTFTYSTVLNGGRLQHRAEKIALDLLTARHADESQTVQFLLRRQRETDLLQTLIHLWRKPGNAALLEHYRRLMDELYGSFDTNDFWGALRYLESRAKATGSDKHFQYIQENIQPIPSGVRLYQPKTETFARYRALLQTSDHTFNKLFANKPTKPLTREKVMQYFAWALEESGATAAGWELKDGTSGSNVMVSRYKKVVIIGGHYYPHSSRRLQQVVAHEVFVHVQRALLGSAENVAEEEGIAIVVEQLTNKYFIYRRMLRYLAAAFAWGVDGTPRTFSQTFELLWRAFVVVGKHEENQAKLRAFNECSRVFRGGVPAIAGAAYTKDKVYFETNIKIWRYLEEAQLDQQAFLKFIDGVEKP